MEHAQHVFRILGPFEVAADDEPISVGGAKARALLALLLLNRNRATPRDRLIDGLWGERPPKAVDAELRVYVAKLRKALGEHVLVTRRDGYALVVDDEAIDATRFERLVDEGRRLLRAGNAAGAAASLREALALWRGPVLADLADEAFVQTEARRLEELRLAALEDRVDADLALGRERELVAELETMIAEHPFRERPRAQLMLALYRCGRQVDALAEYRRTARLFADELGIEPSADLKARERAILEHDPALRRPTLAQPNLPAPPNRLIGREREVEEIEALLSQPETRLVTVVGTGGVGKTRVAVEVAARLEREVGVPAYFVDLAPLTEDDVVGAIATVVGSDDRGDAPARESLRTFLRNARLLVVLDNFEHVLPAAADVAALLADVRGLTILATSRSALQVRAEWRYELGPLRDTDAVALFVERARAIRRGFDPVPAVEDICRRLDALPLAIELAAARTDRFTPETLLRELDSRFDVLADGARDLPGRQRTLRAMVGWSHDLLDPAAREVFSRLAVFAGGCTGGAAEAVCSATSDTIAALADVALVRRDDGRVLMLETIREFALERLRVTGGEDDARRAHAEYYANVAEAARARTPTPEDMARVAVEFDNFRSALRWSREVDNVELHLRLAAAAVAAFALRGHLREADQWLRPAAAVAAGAGTAAHAAAPVLTVAADVAARLGDVRRAYELAGDARRLCRSVGDGRGEARAISVAMLTAARAGDEALRDELVDEFYAAATEIGDLKMAASALRALAAHAARRGDHESGRTLAERSLALARRIDSELDAGQALCHLGVIELQAGRPQDAREPLEESLSIAQRLGYREAAAYSLSGLAALAAAEKDVPRAAELLAAADALFEEVGTARLPFIDDLDSMTRSAVAAARATAG